ncbi:MAG: ATP-binding cassette domain-containing protein [Deltaproteobacteria bacterium]|jgi:phospholipid/cholesterol/gamma-HCH transport system ATP-binding protein|nr:ATP-binding cassette domain-containing protein [Deltaproteobacteria bacterium]
MITIATSTPADAGEAWGIQLEDLRLGYGDLVVLDGIDTTIPGGVITAILGESGGGKSTLLRHIIGLSRPMRGRILYGGKDLFALPGKQFRRARRRFGVLFQDGALLGSLTLAQNVGLPLSENTDLPPATIRNAVLRTLKLVGLDDFADFYPNQLSGGMRKRGGLARAIVTEPPILFCDEPTSGLDPIHAAQMDQLLLDMKIQFPDMTIIVVTHDLASVARIARRVLVLGAGRIVFSGSYEELCAAKDPYLRDFVDRRAARHTLQADPPDPAVREALAAWLRQ